MERGCIYFDRQAGIVCAGGEQCAEKTMTPDLLHRPDAWIEENRSFAVYRLPGSKAVRTIWQEKGSPEALRRLEDLNGKSGFVIAPFEASDSCPVVLIHPDREELTPAPVGTASRSGDEQPAARTRAEAGYEDRFRTFMAPVRAQRFRKLVLSREKILPRDGGFSPSEAFRSACLRDARSYVYLFHTPETGAWLGSTPEILLSGGNGRWNTVALAGTQPLKHHALPDAWNYKNLTEQMLVAQYVRTQLASLGIHPEESVPHTVRAGCLAHLKTEFSFSLPDAGRLGDLLKLLHPTPAVSGLPKEEACRFIAMHEGFSRRYYAGFAGWMDVAGKSSLYVNLRCMYILPASLTLYAGGGLMPSSVMETEWQETEDKLQTMLAVIENQKK
jgi:isochorismate synthase